MVKRGKKYQESLKEYKKSNLYSMDEALDLMPKTAKAKFDESIEISIRLGIDPKRSDQNVRGTVVLPHGTGKTPRVIVFTKGDKAREAEEAKADIVGAEDLIAKIKGGWMNFDIAVATPDMMGQVGSNLGRILGPKMPNPKAGTVTQDIKKTILELKSGKIQYRIDKQGIIHNSIGKISFGKEKLLQNLTIFLEAVIRAKPPASKGNYLKSIVLSSTMGPGIKIDPQKIVAAVSGK